MKEICECGEHCILGAVFEVAGLMDAAEAYSTILGNNGFAMVHPAARIIEGGILDALECFSEAQQAKIIQMVNDFRGMPGQDELPSVAEAWLGVI